MIKKTIWLCLSCLVLLSGAATFGQMAPRGTVVRVMDGLVFIDLGKRDGVMEGDLFDIMSAEVLSHPLTGDTLAITPKSVGAIRVRQVDEKLAIAELLHIQAGHDPMLMQISRVQDPERLAEIEIYLRRQMYGPGGAISRNLALIPGLYQLKTGEKNKGWTLMGLEAVSLIAGVGYRLSSNDWKDQYDNLPAGLLQSEYDRFFDGAQSRRQWSNRFFWLAGAVYVYNLADVLMLGNGMAMSASPPAARRPLALGLGLNRNGTALLQLVHRF